MYWWEDPFWLEVSPETNRLRVGNLDINQYHYRWEQQGRRRRGLFRPVTSVRNGVQSTATSAIIDSEMLWKIDLAPGGE